uniref:Uncharacterized protein n=1 Tax=Anguilla anguilla TaxID=7936 RepID=A0A0E9UNZ6_ANGAN
MHEQCDGFGPDCAIGNWNHNLLIKADSTEKAWHSCV